MSSCTSSSETPAESMTTVQEKRLKSVKRLIKPRNVLSIKAKCRIIEKLQSGADVSDLSREYKVCKTTIFGIRRNQKQILKFAKQIGDDIGNTRKKMRCTDYGSLEKAVSVWIKEQVEKFGCIPPNKIICSKAVHMSKEIPQAVKFKATIAWLKQFKIRYGWSNLVGGEQWKFGSSSLDCHSNECDRDMDKNESQPSGKDMKIQSNVDDVNRNGQIKDKECHINGVPKPTDEEAFHALEFLLQWCEELGDVSLEELLLLRKLQSVAAKRALASLTRNK